MNLRFQKAPGYSGRYVEEGKAIVIDVRSETTVQKCSDVQQKLFSH
jgi:hypothetical protein